MSIKWLFDWTHNGRRRFCHSSQLSAPLWSTHEQRYASDGTNSRSTWKPGSNADRDPPDVLGIPDFKQFKEGSTSDSIPLELMNRMIDESAALAQRLHEVTARLRTEA